MLSSWKKVLAEKGELYLRIKARPGACANEAREIMADGTLKVDIAAPPVKGRANQELVKFLAELFGVHQEKIKILAGAGERTKLIKISL